MNAKQREFWREQFTDAIIMAAGAAVILGRQDIAQTLNRALSDIDRPAETCYTKANQRETARKTEEKKMKYTLYIESDNGGRAVMLSVGKEWYICDCAPSGCFGDVDILNGTEHEAAARVREAIDAGEVYDEIDCANNLESFRYIPEYDGLTAEQIEEAERETTLTKI